MNDSQFTFQSKTFLANFQTLDQMFRNTNTYFYYIFTDEITLITYFSRADYREHIVCENTIFKSTI